MITILNQMSVENSYPILDLCGLSTDTKPNTVFNGSTFFEMDTGKTHFFNGEENLWIEKTDVYLSDIDINTSGVADVYVEGETFDPTGLVVTAKYTDDSEATIENYDYSPAGALSVDDDTITISYGENGVMRRKTMTIIVNPA